jgi:hypothetical protein
LVGHTKKNITFLDEDWNKFFQAVEKAYGAISPPVNPHKNLGKFQEEDKQICADFLNINFEKLKISNKKEPLKFWEEVFSLKDPIAYLSNAYQLIKPIFYEKKDKIDFTIKTSGEDSLHIEVVSLRNEVIEADIERDTPLYKVTDNEINNESYGKITENLLSMGFQLPSCEEKANQKSQKIIAKLRRLSSGLSNYEENADLEILKRDKDLRFIGLNKLKINEMIDEYEDSSIGAQYEIALIIKEKLRFILGEDPNEMYCFKNIEGEDQLYFIIKHMIIKKNKIIMGKLGRSSKTGESKHILILNGEPYIPKIVIGDIDLVMKMVLSYLKEEYTTNSPFDKIFVVGLKGNFWVFEKQEEWRFKSYPTVFISW